MTTYAERRAARHARIADLIERKKAEANGHYNAARAAVEHIPFGQPILVGHHSEGRHRRDLARSHAAMHKAADTFREVEKLEHVTATRAVLVTDSDAVEVMADKLAKAEELQARMSAANKVVRKFKGDPEGGANALVAACPWLTSADAADLMRPDFAGRLGFADYQLSNNNANIRRMRDRLAELKAAQAAPARSRTVGNVQVDEDPEAQRIRLTFPGKPSKVAIMHLKKHGFRWSPNAGAWQRQLNAAGRYAADQVLAQLAADEPAREAGTIHMSKAEALQRQAEQVEHYGRTRPWLAAAVAAVTTGDQLADGEHPVYLINRHIPRGGDIEAIIAKAEG